MRNAMFALVAIGILAGCASTPEATSSAPGKAQSGSLMPGGPSGGKPKASDTFWVKNKHLDVAYAAKSATQKLDLYLPNEGSGPFSVIIELHPGGFMMGSKSADIDPMLEGLKRGYAVASVNYRLSGEAIWPAAINDVKAAIRFLRANAAAYNLDPGRFAAWGASAGGNLAALAATSGDVASLSDPSLGNQGVSDRVQAAVDWFGPVDFHLIDSDFAALGQTGSMGATNSPTSAESKYLGVTVGTPEAEPLAKAASPITHVSADDPPMVIQHGTEDRNIPITQSRRLAEALERATGKGKVTFTSIEGAGHGGSGFSAAGNVTLILDFLDRVLK